MKEQIIKLLNQGHTYNEIVDKVGCSKATINYHAKSLGLATEQKQYNWTEIQKTVEEEGLSLKDCCSRFGFSKGTRSKAIKEGKLKVPDWKIPIENLLVDNRHTCRTHLKKRLLGSGLLLNECYECGISEWRGNKLSLQLHHINGINKDNRIENLSLLCPNCHSLTDNYCGKNSKRL